MRVLSHLFLPALLSIATVAFFDGPTHRVGPGAVRSTGYNTEFELEPCRRGDERAASCGRCHVAIYEEWHGRAHNRAWTDPIYQAALAKRKRPERCHGCHIPTAVQRRLGQRPKARQTNLDEGVTCVACHQVRGGMAGPLGTKTAAHPTVKHPGFTKKGSQSLCASCHDTKIGPVLPVARDFAAAGLAAKGKSCVGCHMPSVTRPIARDPESGAAGPPRTGRKHRILGPNDKSFCRKAFKISARREGEFFVLSIANRTGHRVPGLVGRKFPFIVEQRNADGTKVTGQTIEISADNFLKVEEIREFRFEADPKTQKLVVAVRHQIGDTDVSLTEKAFSF